MASTKFELKLEDVIRINDIIKSYSGDAEKQINDYLSGPGKIKIINSIVNLIPVSDKDKKHAKNSKPLKGVNYNLSLTIRSKRQFNYLYFPQMAEGTSKNNTPNDFMEKGVDSIYDSVVNDLIERLKNI